MKNPNKILVTTSTFPRWEGDSTPTFVQQLAEVVARDSKEVFVLAPHAKGAKPSENKNNVSIKRFRYFYPAQLQDIAYEGGGVNKIKKTPVYGLKLLCFMTALFFSTLWTSVTKKIHIINPHWIVPQGFVAVLVKLITRKKVVLTVHGSDVFSLTGKVMTAVKKFVLRYSDVVCVNSNATKAACEDIYQREYVVIPMGIDTNLFKPAKKSKKLIKKYHLNDFTILFVGRLAEVKGVIHLCEALKLLDQHGYKFKALIAGDGPLKKELQSYIKKNKLIKKVTFTGWLNQSELNDYYSVADVFVGPSLSEAQGIVFLESLATGTPVVASNVGGIPDIVLDGQNGFLVPKKSGEDIYKKLALLADDITLRKRFSENARQGVAERFSWDSVARRYVEVFNREEL